MLLTIKIRIMKKIFGMLCIVFALSMSVACKEEVKQDEVVTGTSVDSTEVQADATSITVEDTTISDTVEVR